MVSCMTNEYVHLQGLKSNRPEKQERVKLILKIISWNVSIFLLHDHLNKVVANTSPEIFAGNLYHIFTYAPPLPTLSLSWLYQVSVFEKHIYLLLTTKLVEPAAGCRGTSHDHWTWVCLDLRQQQPYCIYVGTKIVTRLFSVEILHIYSDYIEKGIHTSDK